VSVVEYPSSARVRSSNECCFGRERRHCNRLIRLLRLRCLWRDQRRPQRVVRLARWLLVNAAAGFPAWLEVQFNGSKTITEINVVTLQDNYNAPIEPTESTTFSLGGLTGYQVQYWNGSVWTTIPGGSVSGNNKVWRKFTFSPLTTTTIRVLTSASADNYSRLTEVEAWTGPSPAPRYNLALGATATASSNYAGWGASSLVNGDRKSLNAGSDGGWVDAAPANTFPDWAQVDFGANKTINEIDVFTLQDNWAGPAEPTESMTFTQFGLTGYQVQYWDGSNWITVPNGSVTGNNKIWRKVIFSTISTSKIRVLTSASVDGHSRLTEIEAYGAPSSGCGTVARLDPLNQTGGAGENPLSRNFNWGLPLVSLPGRTGLVLNIGLSYNSLVWTKDGNYISFDDDYGWPAPGFRLGFPVIQPIHYNQEVGNYGYLLIGSDGSRTELRQVGSSALFESADSAHLLLDTSLPLPSPNHDKFILRTTDGTRLLYAWKGDAYQCTEIKDRNGNYISINYTAVGRVDTVIDTLNRTINFNYDGNGSITSITQTWTINGQAQTHTWASFGYTSKTTQTNFTGLTAIGPSTIQALTQVTRADGSRFKFEYTSWGQVWRISNYAPDNHLLNYHSYNLPLTNATAQTDCPRFTERRDWAENWNRDGNPAAGYMLPTGEEQVVLTTFAEPVSDIWTMPDNTSASGTRAQVTFPDGTSNKIYFMGTVTASGWRRSLPALVNTYDSSAALQRQAMTTWTQDNTNVSYQLNPRVVETNVYDAPPSTNRKRTEITYQQFSFGDGTNCWLPRDVYEYAANATTKLRTLRTSYNDAPVYTSRRILGLVSEKTLYDGDVTGTLVSKFTYQYDETSSLQGNDAPVQHDNTNYTTAFVTGRANLSSVRRYDVTNQSQFTTTSSKYNTAGAVVSTKDALDHEVTISYADAFAAAGTTLDPARPFTTLAYPTTITDPDDYSSSTRYHYDFGATTWKQIPLPNVTTNTPGPEQKINYDSIGRVQQVTNLVNNAFTRYVYGPNYIESFSSINTLTETANEGHTLQVFDGLGRVIAKARSHPASTGGFSAELILYDQVGRVRRSSNPTETNISISGSPLNPSQFAPVGDDIIVNGDHGWEYVEQTYDWKGRPLVTTNQDGSTKTAGYAGCGCAGGEVVTLTDEGNVINFGGTVKKRQKKIYSDVLGRAWKIVLLNWDGSGPYGTGPDNTVYSTTVATYNSRDQVTQVRQYAGAEGGTFQDTTTSYDGYGRVASKHIPEQNSGTATVYTYNADNTILSVTDARGATATHSYNSRHLLTQVTYNAPAGITATATARFDYDAAGNRTSMTDGLGSKSYSYDQLSRMMSETRTFTGVGTFTLSYDYNLAGQIKKVTDASNTTINYGYDVAGQLTAVTGSDTLVGDVSTYASGFQYHAWGGLKQISVGTLNSSFGYNSRVETTNFNISGVVNENYSYHSDGRLRFVYNTTDNNFDRALFYDHVGRLTLAGAGGEARQDTGPAPFSETFVYNAFNDLTQRETESWQDSSYSDAGSFTNHRRDFWGYDASGRITTIDTRTYTYNAAGRNIALAGQQSTPSGFVSTLTESGFDGDGNRVRENSGTSGSMTLRYYLQSSVLGGVVIEELNGSGQKQTGYVYTSSGTPLATQTIGQNFVKFKQVSPLNTTERGVFSNTGSSSRFEFDPVGAKVRNFHITPPDRGDEPGDIPSGGGGSLDSRYSALGNPGAGCTLDGVYMPCYMAMRGVGTASDVMAVDPFYAVTARTSRRTPVWVDEDTSVGQIVKDDAGDSEMTIYSGAGGSYEWIDDPDDVLEVFTQPLMPQNSQQPAPEKEGIAGNLKTALEDQGCSGFIKALLGRVATEANPLVKGGDLLEILKLITAPGQHGLQRGGNDPRSGAQVLGSVGTGNAGIAFGPVGGGYADRGGEALRQILLYHDSLSALHELIHLAGENRYDDLTLATAASQMPNAEKLTDPPAGSDPLGVALFYSNYWDTELRKHCKKPRAPYVP